MPPSGDLATQITATVGAWPGVEVAPHRFGGVEFRYGRRELGHLHGSRLADLPLPKRIRDELVRDGRARPHHVLPDSGWVSIPIASEADVPPLIDVFRMAYERAVAQADRQAAARTATESG